MKQHSLIFLCLLICGFYYNAVAQKNIPSKQKNPCAAALSDNGSHIADANAVIAEPSYKGGENKLYKFIFENLNYPDKARDRGVTGEAIVQFVVEKDGSITNIKIAQSVGYGIDEECIRVVQKMPRWKPGTVNGKPARFQYCLPFKFELQ